MNPIVEENNRDASSNIPEKRKRGRPRKIPDTRSVNMGANAGIGIPPRPPGFHGRNGYLPHRAAPVNATTDAMIGTVVSGVIDGTFDGGYLLSLRVGNSLSTLRGVVFKPGRYVPVTAENDVAPGVQMTRRNAIPIPAEVHSYVHGKRRSRNVNRASKHQQVLPMAAQTVNPLLSRGNLLPVILQPRSSTERIPQTGLSASIAQVVPLPNGSLHPSQVPVTCEPTSVGTQVADVGTSKVQDPSVTSPSDGSVTTIQMPAPLASQGERNENGTLNQPSTETLVGAESITTRLTDMPFENLVSKVVERIDNPSQNPPQSTEIHTEGSESTIDELDNGGVQPLVIEPLQAFFPIAQSTSPSKPPGGSRIGKMSELLQVIQESIGQSEVPIAEVSIRGSSQESDEAS